MLLSSTFAVLLLAASSIAHPVEERAEFQEENFAIDQHRSTRELMITLEKTERQDAKFRERLSGNCTRADRIVHNVRQEEWNTVWREGEGTYPGQMFGLARGRIATTMLWNITRRMPKGALLHAHLTAMLPFDKLLRIVLDTPGMHVRSSVSLATPTQRQTAKVYFKYINVDLPTTASISTVSVNDPAYPSDGQGGWWPLQQAADAFPGGEASFSEFALSKMMIQPEDARRHDLGVDEVWQRFEPFFDQGGTMLEYEPIVRQFWGELFQELVEDRISWVEIRAGGSKGKLVLNGTNEPDPDDADIWWTVMQEELDSFKAARAESAGTDADGSVDPFHGARVIYSQARGARKESIRNNMRNALGRKQKFPEIFSGYDLIAQEDLGATLLDLAPELLWFQQEAKEKNLTVPFFFHAGETLGDGNATDLNLFDAVLLGTRRIGHGFSLYKHPELIQAVKKKNIMVEVCPISNEVLRLATDILHHPMPAMVAHGVATAISNDDPAMLGQEAAGLSYDFYQVIQGFDNIGLAGLGAIAQNSLRWANFEDQDDRAWGLDIELGEFGGGTKGDRIREWNAQFELYCQEVNRDYAAYDY
ncbi:adenosine/AMP deaminase [Colletotrichum sojae]|uniref:adenosine deaminase n=1 Tax=Colletotrichum sojae TaxID=2175907 RepID=A0A8H6N231_9PEZI|nr:adenosine/AMP deaminase [Colletotrichum sojae]